MWHFPSDDVGSLWSGHHPPAPKQYPGVPRVPLPWPGPGSPPCDGAAVDRLSALLLGYGPRRVETMTAAGSCAQFDGPIASMALRLLPARLALHFTVPSGGAFYPIELYVAWAGADGLPSGVYHDDRVHHCLERLRSGGSAAHLDRILGLSNAPRHAVLLAYRPWKNSGKYRAFGYRLSAMDAGAVLGQLAVARPDGLVHLDPDPSAAAELLGLDTEIETVYAALELPATASAAGPLTPATAAAAGLDDDRLRFASADPENVARHRATVFGAAACRCARSIGGPPGARRDSDSDPQGIALPLVAPLAPGDLARVAGRRVSANHLGAGLTAGQLGAVLASAARSHTLCDWPLYPRIWCQVREVAGVPTAVYRYDPDRHRLVPANSPDVAYEEAALPWRVDRRMTAVGATVYLVSPVRTLDLCPHAYRQLYVLAGVALQTVALAAGAVGAASRPLGGFAPEAVIARLDLPEGSVPLLQVLLGMPFPRSGSLTAYLTEGHADA